MKFAAVATCFLASAIAAPLEERSDSYPVSQFKTGKGAYSKDADYRLPGDYSYPKGSDYGNGHYAGYRRNDDYDGHHDHHDHYDGDFRGRKGYPHGGYPRGYPYNYNGGDWNGPRGGNWNNFPGGNFPGGNNPGNFPGGNNPGNFPGGNNPGNFPGGNNPGNFPGGNNPGNFPGGNNPGGNNPGGNNPGGNNGGKSCPKGLLYSVPQCCAADVLGVADVGCEKPTSGTASSFSCSSGTPKCCAIPLPGVASVLCTDASG